MTEYVARYPEGAARGFAIRAWIVAAFLVGALVLVLVMLPTWANLFWGIVATIFVAIAAIWGVVTAVRAPHRWSADDRLAIALSDAGVTIPNAGLIPWEKVIGFEVFDKGLMTGNVAVAALQFLNGTRNAEEIRVWVRGSDVTWYRKLGSRGRQHLRATGETGKIGLATAWGAGLKNPSFREVAAAVEAAAAERGLPVTH